MSKNQPRVLAVILARGGSKSIPKKNIKPLGGVPLIAYTIIEALRAKNVSRIIVSSDDSEICDVAKTYGADVPFIRPAELASDTATSLDAVQHALEFVEAEEGQKYDYVVELLCTSPMKIAADIDHAIDKLIETGADSVIGVARLDDHHPIRIKKIVDDRIQDFVLKEVPGTHRQQLTPEAYIRNGTIYASRRDKLADRVGSPNSRPLIMPQERSINIDAPIDFEFAEMLVKKYPRDYIKKINGNKNSLDLTNIVFPQKNAEKRVLITSSPFGVPIETPIKFLKENNVDFVDNPWKRPPSEEELIQEIENYGILLAGSSPITRRVIESAPHLRMIARAGVGFDNVDLVAARERNIIVTNTPTAHAPAVAEFAMTQILMLLRRIYLADRDLRNSQWQKQIGSLLANQKVGVIGTGVVGHKLIQLLSGFECEILAYDIYQNPELTGTNRFSWAPDLETIYSEADIITLHVPLTDKTYHMIGKAEFEKMKSNVLIINTGRGGLINEDELYQALSNGKIVGAAIDVFEKEPYYGKLTELQNCLLSPHMAAGTTDCKASIELEAATEIIRFLNHKPPVNLIHTGGSN